MPPGQLLTQEGLKSLEAMRARIRAEDTLWQGDVPEDDVISEKAGQIGHLRVESLAQNNLLGLAEEELAALDELQDERFAGVTARLRQEMQRVKDWMQEVNARVEELMKHPGVSNEIHGEALEEQAVLDFSVQHSALKAQLIQEVQPIIGELVAALRDKEAQMAQFVDARGRTPRYQVQDAEHAYNTHVRLDLIPWNATKDRRKFLWDELKPIIDTAERELDFDWEKISGKLDEVESKLKFYERTKRKDVEFVRNSKERFTAYAAAVANQRAAEECFRKCTIDLVQRIQKLKAVIRKARTADAKLVEYGLSKNGLITFELLRRCCTAHPEMEAVWRTAELTINIPSIQDIQTQSQLELLLQP